MCTAGREEAVAAHWACLGLIFYLFLPYRLWCSFLTPGGIMSSLYTLEWAMSALVMAQSQRSHWFYEYFNCTPSWNCRIPAELDSDQEEVLSMGFIIKAYFQTKSVLLVFRATLYYTSVVPKDFHIMRGEHKVTTVFFGQIEQCVIARPTKGLSRNHSNGILINEKHSFLYWPFKRLLRLPLKRWALIIKQSYISFREI